LPSEKCKSELEGVDLEESECFCFLGIPLTTLLPVKTRLSSEKSEAKGPTNYKARNFAPTIYILVVNRF